MPSIGPQLSPPLPEKRKRDEEDGGDADRSPTPDSTSKRQRVIGPALPPTDAGEKVSTRAKDGEAESSSSDDDDDFGPSLPSNTESEAQSQPLTESRPPLSSAPRPAHQRDEWMTLAPASGDWSARVDPTKLKNRKFNTSKGPTVSSANDASSDMWHETPEEKQVRLRREMMGIKDKDEGPKPAATKEIPDSGEDVATAKRIKDYNQSRGPSLYQAHQKKTTTEEDDDPSARAFDREKDIRGGLQLNSTQRRDMMKNASSFSSRFSSAKYL